MNRATIHIRLTLLLFFLLCLPHVFDSYNCCNYSSSIIYAQTSTQNDSDRTVIPFEEKLRYYLNQKTQGIIEELYARELQLSQLITDTKLKFSIADKKEALR